MAEGKYGRLFTEDDVLRILRYGADRDWSEIMEEFDGPGGRGLTFPADEPLFLLRGQDLAAHGGAWSYAYEASRVGASVEFVTEALKHANDLRDWAEKNRSRMKVPD